MKFCSGCRQTKLLTEFWKNKSTRDGLQAYCKECWKRVTTKRRNGPNRDIELRQRKNRHLIREYGIDIEQYEEMFKKQNGECAICSADLAGTNQHGVIKLAVDHNHKTGKVRGLLCQNCNRGLGMFYDNVDFLTAAITYLNRN